MELSAKVGVPEEECKNLFPSLRLAIEIVFDEEIVAKEKTKPKFPGISVSTFVST